MKPIHRGILPAIFTTSALLAVAVPAQAAEWDAGAWKLGLGGNINQFYVRTSCGDANKAAGTTLSGLVCAGADDRSSIQNGLLPASLNFSAKTNQEGWDISANVNVYYGTVSQSNPDSGADALQFSTVDARQVFLTFGKSDVGSFKFGRDFGLFAYDPIINDMTLLGVGAGFAASEPGHTTLGSLGYGYAYTDRLSQINYTSPDMGGVTVTVGMFQPFSGAGGADDETTAADESYTVAAGDSTGFHAKVTYAWKGDVSGKVSASYLSQTVDVVDSADASNSGDIKGFDVYASVSMGDASVSAYLGDAEGMSTLAIGGLVFPAFNAAGDAEESEWTMLQGTYQVMPKLKLGLNWSKSEQTKLTKVENTKTTLGAYYNLTESLRLVGEFSTQESKISGDGTDESDNINLGAILFF